MRVQKRIPWLFSLGVVLGAMALWGTRAGADVTSDRPGSVVVWPKVIADGTRDTLITLTNTSNQQAYAHCQYILGTGVCSLTPQFCSVPAAIPGGGSPDCEQINGASANTCEISWQVGDFDVILTRQQPTIWRVSTGRVEDLSLPDNAKCVDFVQGMTPRQSCPGLFPIGNVPPPPPAALLGTGPNDATFRGELRCIQVNADGSALAGNALKGEAIIETLGSNQTSEYSAIDILGEDGVSDASPDVIKLNGIEYNACPEAVDLTHYAPNEEDLVAAQIGSPCTTSGCPVRTEITLTPCRSDFAASVGTPFRADFNVWDEFEVFFSIEQPFDCWANVDLTQLHFSDVQGSTFQHTRVISQGSGICIAGVNQGLVGCTQDLPDCGAGGVCAPASGLLAIVEQFHADDESLAAPGPPGFPSPLLINVGTDAANSHSVDLNGDGSLQRLGHCRNKLTQTCSMDSDCPPGNCRISTTTTCLTDSVCNTINADCVAAGNPAQCCTGPSTGNCVAGDFCDRCMNDEITFEPDVVVQPVQ
jgi:hypothetical protein